MGVRVGRYIAPRGGSNIVGRLEKLVEMIAISSVGGSPLLPIQHDPWLAHCEFETLHPFIDGNGRTGRALWARHMLLLGRDPFALSFLHCWYYQTLEHADGRYGA
jgi:hypothetical protein